MRTVANLSDLERIARRKIPKWVFEYAHGGSYDERTMNANRDDLLAIKLEQRVLVDVSSRQFETSIAGMPMALPLAIAPTGLAGFFHPDGEIHSARAAKAAGIPYCLSTVSICSIEDVAEATGPFWFQIYVMRDQGFTRSLIERAKAAGCPALVLTVDLPLQAQRHRDIRNGLVVPPRLTPRNLMEMALKYRWSIGVAKAGRFSFGNFRDVKTSGMTTFAQWVADSFDPSFTWDDVGWIREMWQGKLIVKGVLNVNDARMALKVGADAVVVSNHGGRQLDGAPSSISVLPAIADALDGTELILDGGIRNGQDVLKALALGARACLIGRAQLYGLAAAGEVGVSKVIDLIRKELDTSMALTGCIDVRKVFRSVIHAPSK
ncbi:alpha-hydroxy-acid oxidizing protein [Pseudaminobacter arsenicus]|uniref:Alpha-hydroxy-acid oxidizing protein n=1 Tax=Borborobacter arsenicus TaxID=1851146 RepID=A0A432VBK0_9HYPH|nr:alpha-hydroxy acid oxidase [Pseudaminobacter arsenicus]RUM99515.1 alpha-hydroxy-acid oxidizing protein [Pseudaminobacter arsenicus]